MRATAALLALALPAAAAAVFAGSAGCSTDSVLPDTGGPDAGPFTVSGTVQPFPVATSWYAAQGKGTPPREGLSLRLEDPYVAAHLPDGGVDVASTVGADGRFSFVDVAGRVAVGLAAIVTDPRRAPVAVPSESFLFEGGPQSASETAAYVLPSEFAAALAGATGIAGLQAKGFLLGVVLDATGHPVAGAGVVGHDLDNARTLYLGADLKPMPGATATGASGAFLVPGTFDLMNFSLVGVEGYAQHKALGRAGQAFLIAFKP